MTIAVLFVHKDRRTSDGTEMFFERWTKEQETAGNPWCFASICTNCFEKCTSCFENF